MKAINFINKSLCTRCAEKMSQAAKWGGLEDPQTCSEKIYVSSEECQTISDMFKSFREKGGGYLGNIVSQSFYTARQLRIVYDYLDCVFIK